MSDRSCWSPASRSSRGSPAALSRRNSVPVGLVLLLAACSTNREVLSTPQPQDFAAYVASHHPEDILVRDTRGGDHWVHHPVVDGDTLRGVRSRDLPQPQIAIAISDVSRVQEPHFSGGKTLGAVRILVATVGVALVILASSVGTSYTY